jgi:hypothetical protein
MNWTQNTPESSAVRCAEKMLASSEKMLRLRVDINKVRAEGMKVEIAPPVSKHYRPNRLAPKKVDSTLEAALEDLVKTHGAFPPYGQTTAFAKKHGLPKIRLFNRLRKHRTAK